MMFTAQADRQTLSTSLSGATSPQSVAAGAVQPGAGKGLVDPLQQSQSRSSAAQASGNLLLSPISPLLPNLPILTITDNTLNTARNLGTLNSLLSTTGYVGSSDTVDYYRFNRTTSGAFNLSLGGLTADADVRLIQDFNGNGIVDGSDVIAGSYRLSTKDESINLASLASGNYFVEVKQYSGNTNYTLRLSNSSPNNLLPTETEIGAVSGTRVFSGSVNTTNTSEVYRFSLTSTRTVNFTLSGLSGDADIRLIRDYNNNGVVDTGEALASSARGGAAAEWMSRSLGSGNYFIQVNRYSADTSYHMSVSTGDWYSANLSDAGVLGEARFAGFNGGGITRNEMISILREAKDDATVSAAELSDLRKVVSSLGYMMPASVKNLASKVVNSDPANPRSGIGNLFAGSSSTQMERLIGKWFLGNDRPTAPGTTYQYVSGSLFQGGISYLDVDQNAAADCYFLSSLGAAAFRSPSTISNMFTDNGDGTFTVRFFRNGVADYVTVDRYLPTNGSNGAVFAGWGGGANTSISNELWVALAEKAYAQINQSGWIGQDNTNTYAGIDYGWHEPTLEQITGLNATDHSMTYSTVGGLISAFNTGKMVSLCTYNSTTSGIVGNHCYTMIGYNAATDSFRVYNPWGYNNDAQAERWISRSQLVSNFSGWAST